MMDFDFIVFVIGRWCENTFGKEFSSSRTDRALRILEEAAELCQSEGVSKNFVDKVTTSVYERPKGTPHKEVGGVFVTLCAYLATLGFPGAHHLVMQEVDRILTKDPEEFRRRNAEKVHDGITTVQPQERRQ